MKGSETVKLILKLMAIIGIIWGLGWILYENTFLSNHFTTSNYQNMLLVIMSATWLILLLSNVGKEPKTNCQPIIRLCTENPTHAHNKRKTQTTKKPSPTKKQSIVKEILAKYETQEDSS